MVPGEIIPGKDMIVVNCDMPVTALSVTNTGTVPVHLTSHFHIFEANRRLLFDRRRAWGMRLDIAADESIRIEPGATEVVHLVRIAGKRVVHGFNGAVDGPLDVLDIDEAVQRLVARGFLNAPASEVLSTASE